MSDEILVGVQVTDEAGYAEYRRRMTPLLHQHGGRFVLDVRVSEVLRAPEDAAFNRLFTIRFPDAEQRARFFSSPEYLAIRAEHFDPSVSAAAQLGSLLARVEQR